MQFFFCKDEKSVLCLDYNDREEHDELEWVSHGIGWF